MENTRTTARCFDFFHAKINLSALDEQKIGLPRTPLARNRLFQQNPSEADTQHLPVEALEKRRIHERYLLEWVRYCLIETAKAYGIETYA